MSARLPKLFVALAFAAQAWPCSVMSIRSAPGLVKDAYAIVRATAVEYAVPPADPTVRSSGAADSKVRFQVAETIAGPSPGEVILPGVLDDADDFNDQPVPYTTVRPGGRGGSCYAPNYRAGAQYLLFLGKLQEGVLTVNWSPLAPVNEQLHSGRDPWLGWVREQVNAIRPADRPKAPRGGAARNDSPLPCTTPPATPRAAEVPRDPSLRASK